MVSPITSKGQVTTRGFNEWITGRLKEQANIKTSIGQCTAQLPDIEAVRCLTQHGLR